MMSFYELLKYYYENRDITGYTKEEIYKWVTLGRITEEEYRTIVGE